MADITPNPQKGRAKASTALTLSSPMLPHSFLWYLISACLIRSLPSPPSPACINVGPSFQPKHKHTRKGLKYQQTEQPGYGN